MRALHRWRPSLRMARRDLWAHRLRTVVAVVLVALPITAAVVAATVVTTDDYYSANSLRARFGTADAQVAVTERDVARLTLAQPDGSVFPEFPRRAGRRDPESVDLAALLPPGSRTTRVGHVAVDLASGGQLEAAIGDLDDPLTSGMLPELVSGRAPSAPDEVAVTGLVADELAEDGTIELRDGSRVTVVGLIEGTEVYGAGSVLAPPDTVLRGTGADPQEWPTYQVDLPDLSTAELQALQRDLASAGVSAWMRDSVEHPGAWGTPREVPAEVDPAAAAVGALVIGLGLVEVVVVVGAVFAVGARRQGRVLGLLVASGATSTDVRRTVLAQGLCVGLVAAALGGAGAWAVLALGRGPLGQVTGSRYLDWSVPVAGVVTTLALGVLSAVVAAALPAWGVGRMTAAQALDGHVATGPRARRHRTRTPGLWLVAAGLGGLAVCAPWIAWDYRLSDVVGEGRGQAMVVAPGGESPVPVLLGGLCALVLLVGTGLLVPWLVDLTGRVTARGWLPWRLASRDAARNRGRTVASVLAVGVVTTGAVFTGFAVSASAGTSAASEGLLPADVAEVYLPEGVDRDPRALDALEANLAEVLGATSLHPWSNAYSRGAMLVSRQFAGVRVVDDGFLAAAGVGAEDRQRFAEGAAIVASRGIAEDGEVLLRSNRRPGAVRASVPAVELSLDWASYEPVWISADLAERLGARVEPAYAAWAVVPRAPTQAQADRLALRGITVYLEYVDQERGPAVVLIGAAGALALTALVVGLVVALAASDSRDDTATLVAVGAPLRLRRAVSAGHALFVGGLGAGLGLLLGTAGGASLTQVLGSPGTPVPWAALGLLLVGVPLTCAVVGWLVAPGRLVLTRRAG